MHARNDREEGERQVHDHILIFLKMKPALLAFQLGVPFFCHCSLQTPPDEYTLPENVDTAVNSPLPSTMEVPVDMATVSFWQAVVDSKTNSSYYWNPATNEVSWTLPPNSVITNEQPVPALTGTGEAAGAPVGGTLQDYYAYYSQQIYGVDASSQVQNAAAAVTEESKDKNAQVKCVCVCVCG